LEAETLRKERDEIRSELTKIHRTEQSISERYEDSLIKLQEDNAELHSRITRLNKQNKSLQEQVDYLREQLNAHLDKKRGGGGSAAGSFV